MSDPFRFKEFSLQHSKSSMKVGTDGLVLGAWADIIDDERILDIGTGCGLIALMIAQRNKEADIYGIDIHDSSIAEAQCNAKNSPWKNQITFELSSLQMYQPPIQFDHIISNPPFFESGSQSPKKQRLDARHVTTLSFDDLVSNVERLLKPTGKLSLILPTKEYNSMEQKLKSHDFHLIKKDEFIPKPNKGVERILATFSKQKIPPVYGEIIHYNDDNQWSKKYIELTKDFHIKL